MTVPGVCPTCQAELIRIFRWNSSKVERVECVDAEEHAFAVIGEGRDQRLESIEPALP